MATGEDDNFVSDNFLTYPIVAQYIRIVPQRWIRLISMRVEVYGCDYGMLVKMIVYNIVCISNQYFSHSYFGIV